MNSSSLIGRLKLKSIEPLLRGTLSAGVRGGSAADYKRCKWIREVVGATKSEFSRYI